MQLPKRLPCQRVSLLAGDTTPAVGMLTLRDLVQITAKERAVRGAAVVLGLLRHIQVGVVREAEEVERRLPALLELALVREMLLTGGNTSHVLLRTAYLSPHGLLLLSSVFTRR